MSVRTKFHLLAGESLIEINIISPPLQLCIKSTLLLRRQGGKMTSTNICWPCFGAVLVTCPPASQCVTGDSKKHAGWSGKWRKQINTHSVSLHSWKSRGSRESTSALTFKIEKMLLRHTPYVSFSLRVLVLENISYLWAGGSSVSGLARSAVVTLRVGKREATVAKYIIEVFTKLVNQKC